MKRYQHTDSPFELLVNRREELSEAYRKVYGKKGNRYVEANYWLPIWIKEYDSAIKGLCNGKG